LIKSYVYVLINKDTVFHICDHSNSIYLPFLPKNKSLITCHDVIAIRGAMGLKDANCEPSGFGKILQNKIFNNLKKAKYIAMVSENTKNQFVEINHFVGNKPHITVIKNGLNQDFKKLAKSEWQQNTFTLPNKPFLLHVGSNLPRKNRIILPQILKGLQENFDGYLCFAGKRPDSALANEIKRLNLSHRVMVFEEVSQEELNLLYNSCFAFVFPSFSEGFGWPII